MSSLHTVSTCVLIRRVYDVQTFLGYIKSEKCEIQQFSGKYGRIRGEKVTFSL